ncbi:hypothetical protein [Mesorhizobium sp.]|uniref:hypothetical protein n=1 Tax=Mesorhizobium sp. TaxID=1871066 RepID=UPI000FE76C6E|nr:hypothetical protein [Mesorhizobium sp.]RWO55672.1 MAG: hypothetical protein EOS13_00880 [Mesorhizobium sp.]
MVKEEDRAMIPKSGNRFSEKIMVKEEDRAMIPKSGNRFSEKIMVKEEDRAPSRLAGWNRL